MDRLQVLIGGVGNIFLGDDAFGVEVVQRLAQRPLPEGVHVVDFGIRGLDLAYALLDGYETVILVDALPRGDAPGTLYVLEPTLTEPVLADAHNLVPTRVLQMVSALVGQLPQLMVVGCEPSPVTGEDDFKMELSAPVRAAVNEAVEVIEQLIAEICGPRSITEISPCHLPCQTT